MLRAETGGEGVGTALLVSLMVRTSAGLTSHFVIESPQAHPLVPQLRDQNLSPGEHAVECVLGELHVANAPHTRLALLLFLEQLLLASQVPAPHGLTRA